MRSKAILMGLFFCKIVFADNTHDLQKALDKARIYNEVGAMQMTVIAPGQKPITVSSGITQKSKKGMVVTPKTLFQIGSETKSFTAALLLKLEQEGKLSLTDNLEKYFPEYELWQQITLQQMLHNISGIPNYSEDKDFQKTIEEKPNSKWQPKELVAIAEKMHDNFPPGQGWHYSNTNFILAGMIAEKVTGKTLADLYKSYFLIPLQLKQTFYLPYSYSPSMLRTMAHGYDETNKDITNMNMSWAGAAGAMVSNSTDLANWAYDLFHGKAVSETELGKMLQLVSTQTGLPVLPDDKEGYGLGIGMRTTDQYGKWYGHEGETLGYHAIFIWFPDYDLTVAIIANGPAKQLRDFATSLPGLLKLPALESGPQIKSAK